MSKMFKAVAMWCLVEFCLALYKVTYEKQTVIDATSGVFQDLVETIVHGCQIALVVGTKLYNYSPIIAYLVAIVVFGLLFVYIKNIFKLLRLVIKFILFLCAVYVVFLIQSTFIYFIATHVFHVEYTAIAEAIIMKTTVVLMQINHLTPIIHSIATKFFHMDYATMEQVIATKLSSLAH